jgi:hypothetical protein
MIRTLPVTEDMVSLAPAATAIIYVGCNGLPVDPGSVAIGLDDAFVVPMDIVAGDPESVPIAADISAIAERLRCSPDRSSLQRILHLACAQITDEIRAEIESNPRAATRQQMASMEIPSMDELLREMEAAQAHPSASS